jgi:hypothetical protein
MSNIFQGRVYVEKPKRLKRQRARSNPPPPGKSSSDDDDDDAESAARKMKKLADEQAEQEMQQEEADFEEFGPDEAGDSYSDSQKSMAF